MLTTRLDETVENDIWKDVQTIVAAIRDSGLDFDAIYLVGSFGRGEGNVHFDGERWRGLNDYDVLVVTDLPVPDRNLLKQLGRELASVVCTDYVDIGVLPHLDLPLLTPTIANYDFKYAGTLIAGRELRAQVPEFSATDISPYEFARLICNRTAGLLSTRMPERASARRYCVNQYVKACIAVGDIVVYLECGYHSSYRERLARLLSVRGKVISGVSLSNDAMDTLVAAYETKLGIRNIDMFRVEEIAMKAMIDAAFRAIAVRCLGTVCGSLYQVGGKLVRHVSSRAGLFARMDSIVASWLRSNSRPTEMANRVLFSLPGFYAGGSALAFKYLHNFWCVPGALVKPWDPQSAYLLWEEYCH